MKRIRQSIFLIPIMIGVVACGAATPAALPTITPSTVPQPTKIVVSATVSPTQTPSSTPTLPTPTWTPLPTIEPNMGLQTLYAWFGGSDDCQLPCWAGITPGQTGWDEARYLIEPMSGFAKLKYFFNESCTFGECNEISWSLPSPGDAHGYIYSQLLEDKIHAVIVELTDPSLMGAIGLQNVLSSYGKPAILLFSTEPDRPGQKFLELILVYPERQFIISYSKYADLNGDKLESCDSDSYIKLVVLDNSEQLMTLDAIASAVETKDFYVDIWHKSVEESTGMTIDEFYEIFSKTGALCITTPISVWQP